MCVCVRVCRLNEEHGGAAARVDARSDVESEDDNDDADYTVFECRGLATVSQSLTYSHTHAKFHETRSSVGGLYRVSLC